MLNLCFLGGIHEGLQMAKEQSTVQGENILLFDDFSIGCLQESLSPDFRWAEIMKTLKIKPAISKQEWKAEYLRCHEKIEKADAVTIWYSKNPVEYCGMMYVIWFLKEKDIPVYLVCPEQIAESNTELETIESFGQIEPDKVEVFALADKNKNKLSCEERNKIVCQWQRCILENTSCRILKQGEVLSVGLDIYDELILSKIGKVPKAVFEIVGEILGKEMLKTGDAFIISRLKSLLSEDRICVKTQEKAFIFAKICKNS